MIIKTDKYLECVSNKNTRLTKDILISLIKFSPNFTYNKEADTIELKTKPLKNILTINFNMNEENGKNNKKIITDKIKLNELISFDDKSILSHNFVEESKEELLELRVVTDSESACFKFKSDIESKGLIVNVESENFKEKVIQKNLNFNFKSSKKENYNPRKLSDNLNPNEMNNNKFNTSINNHKSSFNSKNKFDVSENLYAQTTTKPTTHPGYKGKRSFNKFDTPINNYNENILLNSKNDQNYEVNNTSKPTISSFYSFKELCSVYLSMKSQNLFSNPKSLESLDKNSEFSNSTFKQCLDHFKEANKDSGYRERANTECVFHFKSNFLFICIKKFCLKINIFYSSMLILLLILINI